MKVFNILGLTILSAGVLGLFGFVLYKFFQDIEVHSIVKWGIVAIILGAVIILISFISERVKEKKHDTHNN